MQAVKGVTFRMIENKDKQAGPRQGFKIRNSNGHDAEAE